MRVGDVGGLADWAGKCRILGRAGPFVLVTSLSSPALPGTAGGDLLLLRDNYMAYYYTYTKPIVLPKEVNSPRRRES